MRTRARRSSYSPSPRSTSANSPPRWTMKRKSRMSDAKAFAAVVREFVMRKLEPIAADVRLVVGRVKAIEDRPAPEKGEPGRSAYELAVDHGFAGVKQQWL